MTKHFCDRCGNQLGEDCVAVFSVNPWPSGIRYDAARDRTVLSAARDAEGGVKELCFVCASGLGGYLKAQPRSAVLT